MSYCFQMTIQSILEISLSHHYEGNLELFNNNGATFENPLDSTKDFYLAVSEDGGNEVDWCIAVTHEEDLLPVVNKFLNDLEEDLDFKKYANKNELNLS